MLYSVEFFTNDKLQINLTEKIENDKWAASNEQFATSGGIFSSERQCEFSSFGSRPSFGEPPPAASCHHVARKSGETVRMDSDRK